MGSLRRVHFRWVIWPSRSDVVGVIRGQTRGHDRPGLARIPIPVGVVRGVRTGVGSTAAAGVRRRGRTRRAEGEAGKGRNRLTRRWPRQLRSRLPLKMWRYFRRTSLGFRAADRLRSSSV
uniref:(northern house mosquito) hypothetical protein n=1 Tax=Culex pipiens TaxID=7175 RepID=A0A8D8CQ01_CULPI